MEGSFTMTISYQKLRDRAKKIIAIKLAYNQKGTATLAEYFCDKKAHLLEDVEIWEVDEHGDFRILREGS